jgi:hypothetical protein
VTNTTSMNGKEAANHAVPAEDDYGYAQAIKIGNTIHVSGQLSQDDKRMCPKFRLEPTRRCDPPLEFMRQAARTAPRGRAADSRRTSSVLCGSCAPSRCHLGSPERCSSP